MCKLINDDYYLIKGFENWAINKNNQLILDIKKNKYMKQYTDKRGYNYVMFKLGKKKFHKRIHNIMADTFIPKPINKKQVDHIDRNRRNNRLSNLRWVDLYEQSENKRSKTNLPKYIYIERNYNNKIDYWTFCIRNYKLKFKKRFNMYDNLIEDIVKYRNDMLKKYNVLIVD